MSTPSASAANRVITIRSELESTLDAIDDKLNIPKQARRLAARTRASYRDRPVPWILGATVAATVVAGVIAWRVFGDD